MPGDGLQGGAGDVDQSRDDDKDVDRGPADDEDGDHHQDHAGDSSKIPVLFLCGFVWHIRRGDGSTTNKQIM